MLIVQLVFIYHIIKLYLPSTPPLSDEIYDIILIDLFNDTSAVT
jgi:hypothetical protein